MSKAKTPEKMQVAQIGRIWEIPALLMPDRLQEYRDKWNMPLMGTLATQVFPDDCYPYLVISQTKDGKKIMLAPISTDLIEPLPSTTSGSIPVFDHTFREPSEVWNIVIGSVGQRVEATLRDDGKWRLLGSEIEFVLGYARYRRDMRD